MTTTLGPQTTTAGEATPHVCAEPVLIAEHEVLLATAAAASVTPTLTPVVAPSRVRALRMFPATLLARVRAAFATLDDPAPRPRTRYYPRHYGYLEDACLSRAMYRL